jgi:L-asparagine transporter-like permease
MTHSKLSLLTIWISSSVLNISLPENIYTSVPSKCVFIYLISFFMRTKSTREDVRVRKSKQKLQISTWPWEMLNIISLEFVKLIIIVIMTLLTSYDTRYSLCTSLKERTYLCYFYVKCVKTILMNFFYVET